ncbi:hypothetical protein ABPG73_022359 [Tetrahymena malaccensis]
MYDIYEREKKNDGKCFLDVISYLRQNDRGCIPVYFSQMYCTITDCGISDQIPTAEQYYDCLNNKCSFGHIDCLDESAKKTHDCLIKNEQQRKQEKENEEKNKNQKAKEEEKQINQKVDQDQQEGDDQDQQEGNNEEKNNKNEDTQEQEENENPEIQEQTNDQNTNSSIISFAFLLIISILI